MQKFTANDPETKSADVVADNVDALRGQFPDAFTEGKVDFNVLKQLLGGAIDEGEEKYGLNWHGKRAARQSALTPSTGTLRPCPEESVDWETTQNLMIEGDNLEVLKLLQKSYAGKVKLIYIDPPYNTGRDFVYADDFRDSVQAYLSDSGQLDREGFRTSTNSESSGRFHSNWMSMMLPRLICARNLLSEDGLIFISIDQVELAHLKILGDEVFGEENFFAVVTRRAMHTVRNSSKDFNLHADYLLCWGRQKSWFGEDPERYLRQSVDKSDSYTRDDGDDRGPYKLDPLSARNFYTPYEHVFDNGVIWRAPQGSYPRYSQDSLRRMESENRIEFGGTEPRAKRYLAEVQEGQPPNTILAPEDVGFNLDGTKDLRNALGVDKAFSQPKPVKLIRYLLDLAGSRDAVVLDFFSGSGSTAEAVYRANQADGGTRKFILVQLAEPLSSDTPEQATALQYLQEQGLRPVLSELTKQRIRAVGAQIRADGGEGDVGFRCLALDSSNIEAWDPDRGDLDRSLTEAIEHLRGDRAEDDILFELVLKLGLELTVPIETRDVVGKSVYSVGAGTLLVCLADSVDRGDIEAIGRGIVDWHAELDPAGDSTVVFRDSAFADDIAKTNLTAILEQHGLSTVRSL